MPEKKDSDEKKVMLTQEGYDNLVKKLENLKSVKRMEIAERLKAAIALGDLSENSEYTDAKNEQAFLEGEISKLEKQIRNSVIIHDEGGDIISLGSKVKIRFPYATEETYIIAPDNVKTSNPLPIVVALREKKVDDIGKKVDDIIEIQDESGKKTLNYKITKIEKNKYYTIAGLEDKTINTIVGSTKIAPDKDEIKKVGDIIKIEDSAYKITKIEKNNSYTVLVVEDKTINTIVVSIKVAPDNKTINTIVVSAKVTSDKDEISDKSPLAVALSEKKSDNIIKIEDSAYKITKIEENISYTVALLEEKTYIIVGSTEDDPDNVKISDKSPLAVALKGKKVNDIIEFDDESDKKASIYKITKIEKNNSYTVVLLEENATYTIVGSTETDPDSGRISDESPIGAALLGKKAGEFIQVHAPAGILEYKILEIVK